VRAAAQPHAVVFKPEARPVWLGEEPGEPSALKVLLTPFPSDELISWPVSARVGNVKNNGASLAEPIKAAHSSEAVS
jgi:putative SOS response-associated peptidase YedK